MGKKRLVVFAVLMTMCIGGLLASASVASDVPRMTKEELKAMLGNPDLVILDVRAGRDWKSSESKIKDAVREEAGKVDSWAGKYDKDKTYVLYCA